MGSVGVNSDVAPWELPPQALSAGVNFRMSSGKIQSAGGIDLVANSAGDQIGHIAPSRDFNANAKWIIAGGDDIQVWTEGRFVSIKGSLTFSNLQPELWSSCRIGAVTFLSHPDYFPVYWIDQTDTINDAKLLPWDVTGADANGFPTGPTWKDKDFSCRAICSHKNFIFALGMKEGTEEYRDKVWWSHPAEPNGIPLSFVPTIDRPDSIAGNVNLGRGGAIVGGESMRDSFVIYSEDAINVMDFTGDAIGWRRRTVSTSADLIGKEAIVEIKGMQYFISRNDIMMFDGNSMQSLTHNRLRRALGANLNVNAAHTSWATHNQTFNEIWFAMPSSNAEFPDRAYVFNYRDNTWAIRDLEQEFRHGAFGDEPFADDRTWDDFISSYDDDRGSWAMGGDRPFKGALFGVSGEFVFDIDPGVSTYADSNVAYSPDQQGDWDTWTYSDGAQVSSGGVRWLGVNQNPSQTVFAEVDVVPVASLQLNPEDKVRVEVLSRIQLRGNSTRSVPMADPPPPPPPPPPIDSDDGGLFFFEDCLAVVYWNGVEAVRKTYNITEGKSFEAITDTLVIENIPAGENGSLRVEFFSRAPDGMSNVEVVSISSVIVTRQNTRTPTLLQRYDMPIGGHETNTTITRVYPLIEGTAPVEIRVGSAQRAGGPIRWAGDFRVFTPGVDRKLDIRTTGETHAFEIRSAGRAFFDMTGMDIEYSMAGAR